MVRASDTVLNLQTFRRSLAKNIPISALQSGDTVTLHQVDPVASPILNYYKPDHPHYYYHRVDNEKAYATPNKIKQYFLPVSWYDIYDNNGDKSNLSFYLKQVFILLWLISFFVFILSRAKFRI